MKFGGDVHCVKLYRCCSKDRIPSFTQVATATERRTFENLLVLNYQSQSLDILYTSLLRDPLQQLFKLRPWGGHLIFHRTIQDRLKLSFLCCMHNSLDILFLALCSGLLPSLFRGIRDQHQALPGSPICESSCQKP